MKRNIVVEVDDQDEITVTSDTTGETSAEGVEVDQSRGTARILMAAAKKIRKDEGILSLTVMKDLKSQSVGVDFQKDEIKDFGEALGMLEQARRLVEFQQWFGMFAGAQQAIAMQAHAAQQQIQVATAGNGGGLFKGPRR